MTPGAKTAISIAACITLAPLAAAAQAPAFPTRPITIVVPYAAGGSGDVLARMFGEAVGRELGQSVVIDNRTGANGAIGATFVARAKPDGYTLLAMATTHTILPSLEKDLPYQIQRDLEPVFGITELPQVVVTNGKAGARSLQELVTVAKASTAGLNMGSSGSGTLSHLTSLLVMRHLGLQATHVPYRGLAPAAQAILGNQVHFAVLNVPEVLEATRAGEMRALAVTTEKRLAYMPDVPTVVELGIPETVSASWNAFLAPAGTPVAVLDRLHGAFVKAVADPQVQERVGRVRVTIRTMTRPQVAAHMQSEIDRWRKVVEQNQIKADN